MGSNPIGGFASHLAASFGEDGATKSKANCSHGFSLFALLRPVFLWRAPCSQQLGSHSRRPRGKTSRIRTETMIRKCVWEFVSYRSRSHGIRSPSRGPHRIKKWYPHAFGSVGSIERDAWARDGRCQVMGPRECKIEFLVTSPFGFFPQPCEGTEATKKWQEHFLLGAEFR